MLYHYQVFFQLFVYPLICYQILESDLDRIVETKERSRISKQY